LRTDFLRTIPERAVKPGRERAASGLGLIMPAPDQVRGRLCARIQLTEARPCQIK